MDRKVKTPSTRATTEPVPQDPLHGITLANILAKLVDTYGWSELGKRVPIKCFTSDPSIASSLKFLRKTPWARAKVEQLYISTLSLPAKYHRLSG